MTLAAITSPPERSLTQRLDALEGANRIRSARAVLKRDVKAGRVTVHALLRVPPEFVGTMTLADLIICMPKIGRVKVQQILGRCRISPSKTIGGLSERQRNEIIELLAHR